MVEWRMSSQGGDMALRANNVQSAMGGEICWSVTYLLVDDGMGAAGLPIPL